MAKPAKDIEYLPPGWRWVRQGAETWEPSPGVKSTARHARRGDETMSTRQVQNIQRSARAAQNMPKAPTVPRKGKTRTIKFTVEEKRQTDVTKSERLQTGVGTLYNPQRHGRTEALVFRSFDDAREYALFTGLPEWAKVGLITVHFTQRIVTTGKVGSDTNDRNGFASLTGFFDTERASGPNVLKESEANEIIYPWEEAGMNILNYDMSAKYSRVYIYLMEK